MMHSGSGHRTWHLYPQVVHIACETSSLDEARPLLRALAIKEKTAVVDLVNYYLSMHPQQKRKCADCGDLVSIEHFATTKCFDCLQADYTALFA